MKNKNLKLKLVAIVGSLLLLIGLVFFGIIVNIAWLDSPDKTYRELLLSNYNNFTLYYVIGIISLILSSVIFKLGLK